MSKTLKIVIAIIGLLILWVLTLFFRRVPIEQDLSFQVEDVLNRADFSQVDVSFEGRDGTLSGEVSSSALADEAENLARELWGVRVIKNLLKVPTEIATVSANLQGYFQNGKFVLKGVVADEAIRTKLVQLAEKAFGAGNVVDQLSIDPSVQLPDFFEKAFTAFLGLKGIDEAGFSIGEDKFVLKGIVETDAIKAGLGAKLTEILAPLLVQNDLQVLAVEVSKPSIEELRSFFSSNPIEFEFNSTDLTAQSRQTSNRIVEMLQRNSETNIQIEGHTDNIGSNSYNMQLGQKRADSVKGYLVEKSISATRLNTKSYGETQPKASNDTEVGRQRNRRVEFKIN